MIVDSVKAKFDKYKNTLPKDSYCIVIEDTDEGMINFMSYDTSDSPDVSTGYIILRGFMELLQTHTGYLILRGFMELLQTQVDDVIMHGQAAVFREIDIIKPEVKDKMYNKDNITVLNFNNDK